MFRTFLIGTFSCGSGGGAWMAGLIARAGRERGSLVPAAGSWHPGQDF